MLYCEYLHTPLGKKTAQISFLAQSLKMASFICMHVQCTECAVLVARVSCRCLCLSAVFILSLPWNTSISLACQNKVLLTIFWLMWTWCNACYHLCRTAQERTEIFQESFCGHTVVSWNELYWRNLAFVLVDGMFWLCGPSQMSDLYVCWGMLKSMDEHPEAAANPKGERSCEEVGGKMQLLLGSEASVYGV